MAGTDSICRPRPDCHVSGETRRSQPPARSDARASPKPVIVKAMRRRTAALCREIMGKMRRAGHNFVAAPNAIMAPQAAGWRRYHKAASPMQTAGTMSKRFHMIGPRKGTRTIHHSAPARWPSCHIATARMASSSSIVIEKAIGK